MTGHRRRKGHALRRVESWRRSRALFTRRLRNASAPATRTRTAADLLCSAMRRVEPALADRAADQAVAALASITQLLEKEITGDR